ncbi:MAG: tyrosine-protein phosphatase [Treponema sp.]|nr:tyrosine-protein phosphatase [Treponema sp.]
MKIDVKEFGYRFLDNDTFEFYCDKSLYPEIQDDESIYVTGSFNGWLSSADSSWKMELIKKNKEVYYSLIKSVSSIMIPGNSGFPEFKFFRLSNVSYNLIEDDENKRPNIFLKNKIIVRDNEEFERLKFYQTHHEFEKTLQDFDLNCPACRAEIANFRLVPGTKCLYRGYHPFKKSRPEMDTEEQRIALVQKAMDLYGIKSDITLCGYELASEYLGETVPDSIQKIEEKNNRLCVDIEYNLVYFHSDAAEYSVTLRNICQFIINHPGPFYIHCRLGSDRTGVTCAVLASLCGATWKDICEDFEKTTHCGINEIRDRKILQYSIQKMIGYDPSGSKDLAKLMQRYFIKEEILTAKEIDKLIKKLNTPGRKKETDFFDLTGNHICAKRSAKI